MRIAMIALVCLAALGSCSNWQVVRPPAPPEAAMELCEVPAVLPAGDMTQSSVEKHWGRDRSNLRTCRARHEMLVEWTCKLNQSGPGQRAGVVDRKTCAVFLP